MALTTIYRSHLSLLCTGLFSLVALSVNADPVDNNTPHIPDIPNIPPPQNNNDAPPQNNNNPPPTQNNNHIPTPPPDPSPGTSQQNGFQNSTTNSIGVSSTMDTLTNSMEGIDSGVTEGQGDGPGTLRATLSPSDLHWIVFTTYDYGRLDVEGPNGIRSDTHGSSVGVLYRLNPRIAFGSSVGGLTSKGIGSGGSSTVRSDGLTLAAFGVASFGDTFVDLFYSTTLLDNQFDRNPAGTNASGHTDATVQTVALTLGHNHRFGRWVTGPRLGVNYSHWSQKGFSESGTGALLTYSNQNSESLVARFEWFGSYDIPTQLGTITPRARLGWHRETKGGAGASNVEFVAGGVASSAGVNRVRHYMLASAGVVANFGPNWKASADYVGQYFSDSFEVHSVSLMLSYAF